MLERYVESAAKLSGVERAKPESLIAFHVAPRSVIELLGILKELFADLVSDPVIEN